jgi:hypothetical protein
VFVAAGLLSTLKLSIHFPFGDTSGPAVSVAANILVVEI